MFVFQFDAMLMTNPEVPVLSNAQRPVLNGQISCVVKMLEIRHQK